MTTPPATAPVPSSLSITSHIPSNTSTVVVVTASSNLVVIKVKRCLAEPRSELGNISQRCVGCRLLCFFMSDLWLFGQWVVNGHIKQTLRTLISVRCKLFFFFLLVHDLLASFLHCTTFYEFVRDKD
ncbi:hypothetical protein L210DRAFT_3132565 [Boletus edulis BED1]|uniref:Uncharacterized protein n=1 Tax=Boletus edulis BED1 TaxID=1328754 RepID=A0AAD4G810_BOLED|nr:hypothetical protein L210DRAFT_3132565 [Boletus edulis BED1]